MYVLACPVEAQIGSRISRAFYEIYIKSRTGQNVTICIPIEFHGDFCKITPIVPFYVGVQNYKFTFLPIALLQSGVFN